ncbi:MAG: oxidoreductase [Chlorobiales bacterium]|nr:oxidoreductase [Chlorobiales bacterium]
MALQRFGKKGWNPDRVSDLTGKNFLITGGNSGIGLEAARIFLEKGASVTILCRNPEKAVEAVDQLKGDNDSAKIDWIQMDLSSLVSVKKAAGKVRANNDKIDGLILNAGIMMLPERILTEDDIETQIGVNHFGHFAFAGLLSDLVTKAGCRFVIVSSTAHKMGKKKIFFEDINLNGSYTPTVAYAQSKLANILFTRELNKRLSDVNASSVAISCHPGWSATNLQTTGPSKGTGGLLSFMNRLFAQTAELGSWPIVLSAAEDDAIPGRYYGPTKMGQMRGAVGECPMAPYAMDEESARRLWELSEKMTSVTWKF